MTSVFTDKQNLSINQVFLEKDRKNNHTKNSFWLSSLKKSHETVIVGDRDLTIDEVIGVARYDAKVRLTGNYYVWERVQASCEYIFHAVESGQPIYGVNTGFDGIGNVVIPCQGAALFQNNLMCYHKVGAGKRLPLADVRAAMLLRMNSHLHGASGIRPEIIRRMKTFLNVGVTPHVYEFGSIGANGDLTPLAYITGALIGLDSSYIVDFNGKAMNAPTVLEKLGLKPLQLLPKEGWAMINGTSMMSAIAANCVYDTKILLTLTMGVHALALQGLHGTSQSFHPFIHKLKPHSGELEAAQKMLNLLRGSRLIRPELDASGSHNSKPEIQAPYSLCCLPQYIGPIIDGIQQITKQVEIEMNSTTDSQLIDIENQAIYQGGNFLGQYIGVGMDRLRYYIGLLAKHLDAQIAYLVAPEFNNGLSAFLVGNQKRKVNRGLKGLQITGSSIMLLLSFYGNSLADRFPTHAQQYNQNISNQGFASANLARRSVEIFQQYMAVCLMFGLQAVDLRTYIVANHYDARETLSPATRDLYIAVRNVIGKPASAKRPYIWNDNEQALDEHISRIAADIASEGQIVQTFREYQ